MSNKILGLHMAISSHIPPTIILMLFSAFKISGWRIDKHYPSQDGK